MSPLIEAKGLGVRFGQTQVLRDIDLSVDPGEIVTIVGPNGSGKTTLLRALVGAERASTGAVTRVPGLKIGYVPQVLSIDRTMPLSVAAFLRLGENGRRSEIIHALDRVGIAHAVNQQITALSGGQFQRVLLARAILRDPMLLVLDEPTKGLDQPGVASFYHLLDTLRRDLGCGILMVSHDLHVVMSGSDHVICINGHVCCQGTPTVVSQAPEYRALFGFDTGGALALYQHHHDHSHDECGHDGCGQGDAASPSSVGQKQAVHSDRGAKEAETEYQS